MDGVGFVRWGVTTSSALGGSRQLREISRPAQVLPKLCWRPAGVVSGAAKIKEQQRHRTLICYCVYSKWHRVLLAASSIYQDKEERKRHPSAPYLTPSSDCKLVAKSYQSQHWDDVEKAQPSRQPSSEATECHTQLFGCPLRQRCKHGLASLGQNLSFLWRRLCSRSVQLRMMFTPPLLRAPENDILRLLSPSNIRFVEARQSHRINIILRRQPLPVLPWTMPTIGHEQCQNTTKKQRVKKEKKVLKGYHPTGLSTRTKVPTSLVSCRVQGRASNPPIYASGSWPAIPPHLLLPRRAPYRQMIQETGLAVYHAMICRPLGRV